MNLEECFLEMVCHSRWLFGYSLHRLSAACTEEYVDDLLKIQVGLQALSEPCTGAPVDIPAGVVASLCTGVAYLLVAEEVVGQAPTTMHDFLQQTRERRAESAKHAHILACRWLVGNGILNVDDMLGVIFGPETTTAAFESDFAAQSAIAKSLASEEPFFLGAHVTVLRALLLHYCGTIIQSQDVIDHVLKINPRATATLCTLEDTLLFWLRSVLGLVPAAVVGGLLGRLDDLYVGTNDGRALALVVHVYQPHLIAFADIQLAEPLTVMQRRQNWSLVISAAEFLGLAVGVTDEEIVAHGYVTLQLHVLRIVEELFGVLAVGVEESYRVLADNVERSVGSARLHVLDKSSASTASSQATPTGDVSSVELDAHTSLVMVTPQGNHVVPVDVDEASSNSLHVSSRTSTSSRVHAYVSARISAALGGIGDGGSESRFEALGGASGVDTLGPIRGQSSSLARDIVGGSSVDGAPSSTTTDDVGENDVDERAGRGPTPVIGGAPGGPAVGAPDYREPEGDYNIILTNMLLQGMAMPIRKQTAPPPPPVETQETPRPPTHSDTQDVTVYLRASATGGVTVPRGDRTPPGQNSLLIERTDDGPMLDDGPEPTLSPSPVKSARSSTAAGSLVATAPAGGRASACTARQSTVDAALDALATASMARPLPPGRQSQSSSAVVQGSVDAAGIADLIAELRAMNEAPAPAPSAARASGSTDAVYRAYRRQQELVGALLKNVQRGLSDAKSFDSVVRHLRGSTQQQQQQQSQAGGRAASRADAATSCSLHVQQQSRQSIAVGASFASHPLGVPESQQPQQQQQPRAERPAIPPLKLPSLPAGVDVVASITQLPSKLAVQPRNPGGKSPLPPVKPPPSVIDVSVDSLRPGAVGVRPGPKAPPPRIVRRLLQRQPQQPPGNDSAATDDQPPPAPVSGPAPVPHPRRPSAPTAAPPPQQVRTWSNKNNIALALKHCLLSGEVNKKALADALSVMDTTIGDEATAPVAAKGGSGGSGGGGGQFVVLLKDEYTHTLRGLYLLRPDGVLTRVYGAGPPSAFVGPTPPPGETGPMAQHAAQKALLHPKFFKYDVTGKKFTGMPHADANQTTDAVAFAKLPKVSRAI